ncbi:MAG: alpha/beta hydrolase, partial [Spirosoma sp.]|nr:alpha/beta hydrolase [Spirosoma sp.]
TVVAVDLFLHGNSLYRADHLLTKPYWQRLIEAFLEAGRINRFSLMGFSLGGRFALATAEAFPDRLDELILIAPDGITYSIWYQLATKTNVGERLFKYGLRHLSTLYQFGHVIVRLGIINRTVMRFAEMSLSTSSQRALVYAVWTQFRLIDPNIAEVATLLNQHRVRVRFFVGAFDRIITSAAILQMSNKLQRYEITVLRTGHNHLIELTTAELGG